jgi:hypothetical protein
MQVEEWNLETKVQDDDRAKSERLEELPDDSADRFGIRLSLLVLCVAFLIAAIWVIGAPSFEKCSALGNITERNACYGELRNELLKPPAKGGEMPLG